MKKTLKITIAFALVLTVVAVAARGGAETKKKKDGLAGRLANSDTPIQIEADNLVVYRKESKIVFTGNVVLKQAPTVIKTDKVVAYYREKDWEIRKAVCLGNVRIVREDTFARCGRATYDNEKGLILMEKSPVIYQENHIFRGKVLKYYLKDERITGTDVRYQRNPKPPPVAPKEP